MKEYMIVKVQFNVSSKTCTGKLYTFLAYEISIHALREEGDSKNRDKISIFKQIIQHSARI